MLAEGVTNLLFKMGGEESAVFCLLGPDKCFDLPKDYLSDGVTEKVSIVTHATSFGIFLNISYFFQLRLFKMETENDLRAVVKHFVSNLMDDQGAGVLCLLYSVLLSRGIEK